MTEKSGVHFAFLDSGVGGLPYMQRLKKLCPNASCVYVADTKNFPYGEKSEDEIIRNASLCVEKIIQRWKPHAVVIACNTISVTALENLRRRFDGTPFIGTVPAIKPAAALSKKRCIGLLATNATVSHPYTKRLIADFASDCTIVSRGDPELIAFIEHKFFSSTKEEQESAVRPAVDFFAAAGCDAIVLACTHFLNMADVIQRVAGSAVSVVDSREGVARHALDVECALLRTPDDNGAELRASEKRALHDALFVTGFKIPGDEEAYRMFCRNSAVDFGGILEV